MTLNTFSNLTSNPHVKPYHPSFLQKTLHAVTTQNDWPFQFSQYPLIFANTVPFVSINLAFLPDYISYLLLHNKLPQNVMACNTYCLVLQIRNWGLRLGLSQSGNHSAGRGCVPLKALLGRNLFCVHSSGCWQDSVPCLLFADGCPQYFPRWNSPLGAQKMSTCFSKASKREAVLLAR